MLPSHQLSSSSSLDTPRTKVVLRSRHCSSSSFPHTPRTKVVLPSRQFSSFSSPDTPRTKVVLQSRQVSSSSSPQMIRVLKLYYKVASSHLPAPQIPRVLNALSPAFRALDTHDLRRGLRAHGTNRTLACISHSTRTISAEGCTSSFQNKRFVRDFLKNSHVKVCKTSVSYETSSKRQAETPIGAHTSRSPAKQFRDSSPPINIRSHANPNATATFTSTTTHNLTIPCACHESFRVHTSNAHKVLRLPRNVTSVTPRNLTIPCACHKNRTSTPQSPHKALRLPRKVTISSHVSASTKFAPHHTFGMISTRSEHTPIHQTRHFS